MCAARSTPTAPTQDDEDAGDDEPDTVATRDGAEVARVRTRWGVVQVVDLLSRHPSYATLRVEILHGKMPADEKDAVMQAFARGDIDVLVATTVIEVGVDVPNASTMVILEADRFGVSQLHQLRGRVGRGGVPGLCLLVTEARVGSSSARRASRPSRPRSTASQLAEVDLELRGEGDVLGDLQSGARSSLRLLRVVTDAELILVARHAAEKVLTDDPALVRHPGLAEAVERRMSAEERAALGRS